MRCAGGRGGARERGVVCGGCSECTGVRGLGRGHGGAGGGVSGVAPERALAVRPCGVWELGPAGGGARVRGSAGRKRTCGAEARGAWSGSARVLYKKRA